jgi:hypothetical protein
LYLESKVYATSNIGYKDYNEEEFYSNKGFFLYILTGRNEDLTRIKSFILNAINKHDEKVKFMPPKGYRLRSS